jgi:hypothetical protein
MRFYSMVTTLCALALAAGTLFHTAGFSGGRW